MHDWSHRGDQPSRPCGVHSTCQNIVNLQSPPSPPPSPLSSTPQISQALFTSHLTPMMPHRTLPPSIPHHRHLRVSQAKDDVQSIPTDDAQSRIPSPPLRPHRRPPDSVSWGTDQLTAVPE
ncbi:hypothetical protein SODALDRAFT_333379 [Sodiomyces alkalinus F11]|uniref:Uncharacterized protein n=1 Tax=Sodiomyces alkalinus (strain CBS 110278 / VKM F-3762 / F11) TaxID=1314773 RepID=A0A3N2PW68_SODAK|nr:hypothetical protein SODALDRAFT_333379 [Sodiomyces alkalinus F11]ROT38753.1 hypothetical protein SODALDRAFT_333379 [Sodiomyces alkalinus F11]